MSCLPVLVVSRGAAGFRQIVCRSRGRKGASVASDSDPPERPGPSRADRAGDAFLRVAAGMRGALLLATYCNSSTTVVLVIELLVLGLQLAASYSRRR